MNSLVAKILDTYMVTHDVKCFVVEKPKGYDFISGQATDVSINLPQWKDELRPFTFTCLKEDDYLEFMIKIYKDHLGVTHQLGQLKAGDELILHDVFGAIQYKGTGVFIAGGAGITPFISIFRNLNKNKQLRGNRLFYSNKTPDDVIMDEELRGILKNDFIKLFTRKNATGPVHQRINSDFLIENCTDFRQPFYVCGPDEFVRSITSFLLNLGATADSVVFEK